MKGEEPETRRFPCNTTIAFQIASYTACPECHFQSFAAAVSDAAAARTASSRCWSLSRWASNPLLPP
jgi:hypothetical protein